MAAAPAGHRRPERGGAQVLRRPGRSAGRPDRPRGLPGRVPHAAGAAHPGRACSCGHQALQDEIIDSALRQFPVFGTDFRKNINHLTASNAVVLAVGLLWLLYGSMRLSRAPR